MTNIISEATESETALYFQTFHILFKLIFYLIFPFLTGKAQALANFFVEKQRAKEQNRTGSQNQLKKACRAKFTSKIRQITLIQIS